MPKPLEIFDTPEATGRVGDNKKPLRICNKTGVHTCRLGSIHLNEREAKILTEHLTTKDQEKEEAIAKARDQEAKLWFETWYSHYLSPTKPLQGEFAKFATERIQMTGYERDQALPTEDNK